MNINILALILVERALILQSPVETLDLIRSVLIKSNKFSSKKSAFEIAIPLSKQKRRRISGITQIAALQKRMDCNLAGSGMEGHHSYIRQAVTTNRAERSEIIPSQMSDADKLEWMLKDFRESAVPDRLTLINARLVQGDEVIEILVEEIIAQLQKVNSYTTQATRRYLDQYQSLIKGVWLAYGCDPDGLHSGEVACIKPIQPRTTISKGKRKKIKYETPAGMKALPIVPWVDEETAAAIYKRYRVTPFPHETFWQVVRRYNLPIGIAEGLKKALSLIAHGLPTIAVRGVACWHEKGSRELHAAIKYFATPGRTIFIIFDQDEKLSTNINVGREIKNLGTELEQLGCKVLVPTWDKALGKGVDDAIAGRGDQGQVWLDAVLDTAQPLKDLKRSRQIAAALNEINRQNALTYPVERETIGEYLPELPPLERGAIHVLSASMNAGKTLRIGRDYVKQAIAMGCNVLVLAPLNSLGQQTAQDWGLPHIHDFGTSPEQQQALWSYVSTSHGIVLCPDSLHRIPNWFWERPLLIILDEANQVIEHINEGNTLGNRWSNIQERFAAVSAHAIQTGAIVLSEDGIPDRAVDFIKTISGGTKVRVFKHHKQSFPWNCTVYAGAITQASGFRARLLETVIAGQRILTVTSSQREAKRLERAIARVAPSVKTIRIDSETNQQGQFREFFQAPDTWLEVNQPDVLILSPSAKSGVSIQGGVAVEDAYFDAVWGYFPTLATDTHMQLLGRFRPSVPRMIFAPDFILGSGDESFWKQKDLKQRIEINVQCLASVYQIEQLLTLPEERAELASRIESAVLEYISISKTVSGCQKSVAHHALVQRLENAGHIVQCHNLGKDDATAKLWKDVQEDIWREDAEAISTTRLDPEIHTLEWAKNTLDSLECSYEKRLIALKVLWRQEFPGVLFDDAEETYEALCYQYGELRRGVLLQAKAENLKAAKEADRETVETIFKRDIRALHRLPKEYIKARLIAETGVLALLDGKSYSNHDPRAIAIKEKALRYANEIYYFLRLQIKLEQTPVEIAHKLLKKLAIDKDKKDRPGEIQLVARPGRREEKRDNVYRIDLSVNPVRARLLEAARRKLHSSVSSICNKEVTNLQIDDTTKKQQTLPHPKEGVGAVVRRAGEFGCWVIEAISDAGASMKQLDGGLFVSQVPLNELSLVEEAIA